MNLLSKLHKNSILTGPIESYCLACGCLLRSEEEAYAHIHLPQHVDKLQALPQLDNYKDDCILKIKEGYFCPYCNIILPTIKRIGLHVIEPKHKENKIAQSITRHADTILLFDVVVIDPRSWHGVDGTTCSVCNEDFADEKEHTTDPGHALKLIQAKCEFGDNYVYRTVDEDLFFCLICNDILPITDKESHHESKRHELLYKKSTKGVVELNNNNIALEKSDNNLPKVKPTDLSTNVESEKDCKDVSNNYLKEQVIKVDNGSSSGVDDNRAKVATNSQDFNPNYVNLSTEIAQTQVLKTELPNETSEIATIKQEVSEITPPKVIQEAKTDSKNNEDTSKVNEKDKIHINQTQKKIPQDLDKVQALKDLSKKDEETTKNIEVQAKEIKDDVTPCPNVTNINISEPVKPVPIQSNINGTANVIAKDPVSAEPYLYEFLKSLNFVFRTNEREAICILCDLIVDVAKIENHCVAKHHTILYQKHIARKNKLSQKSVQVTDNSKKETNNKIDNTVPATETPKDQKTVNNINKPVKNPTTNVDKEAEVFEESRDKNNKVVLKENVAPENKIDNERIPILQSAAESKNVSSKSIKKAQKKAAKAKARLLSLPSNPTSDRVYYMPDGNITSEEQHTCIATIDGASITVNKKANETNENVVTVNEEAPMTPVNTRNDPETVNETTNGIMANFKAKSEKLLTFIKTMSQVNSSPEDVVINCKYVVGNLSFVLLVRTGDKVKCVACNEQLAVDVHKHIATEEHRINLEECAVVTSLDDEFIRQVKNGEYHCGYCNLALPDWEATRSHLDSYRHSDAKTSASWRLERYLSHMKHSEKKEVRSLLTAVFRQTME